MVGIDVIRELRGRSPVPEVELSARCREEHEAAALDVGADDYLITLLGPPELTERMYAQLWLQSSSGRPEAPSGVKSVINRRQRLSMVAGWADSDG